VQTGGVGVDHIVDVGGPSTIHKSLNAVRNGGQINVIGFLWTGPVRPPQSYLPTTLLTLQTLQDAPNSDLAGLIFSIIRGAIQIRGIFIGSVEK
jgi:NADPH:quinone reductase-like Zn-dependent oxidoreductase